MRKNETTVNNEGRGAIPYDPSADPRTATYAVWADYSPMIPKSDGNSTAPRTGGLQDTIAQIQATYRKSRPQVKQLATFLKAETLEQSAYNIWHFLKTQVQYKLDPSGTEEIRTAARSWDDRYKGVDCEDFSIFVAALLSEMGFKPVFEIVAFNGKPNFGHIFVTVGDYIVDVVMGQFNQLPKNITKTMQIKELSGVPAADNVPPNLNQTSFPGWSLAGLDEAIFGFGEIELPDATTQQLLAEQSRMLAALPNDSETLAAIGKSEKGRQLRKVHALIKLNGDPKARAVLGKLLPLIQDIQPCGKIILKPGVTMELATSFAEVTDMKLSGTLQELDVMHGLSGANSLESDFAGIDENIRSGRWNEGMAGIGNVFKKIGRGLKKVGRGLMTVGAAPIRLAILGAFRINLFGLAKKMKVGYLKPEEAARLNISPENLKKVKNTVRKVEKMFHALGGQKKKLRGAIMKGGGNLFKGLSGVENEYDLSGVEDLSGWGSEYTLDGSTNEEAHLQAMGYLCNELEGIGAAPLAAPFAAAAPFIAKIGILAAKLKPIFALIKGAAGATKAVRGAVAKNKAKRGVSGTEEEMYGLGNFLKNLAAKAGSIIKKVGQGVKKAVSAVKSIGGKKSASNASPAAAAVTPMPGSGGGLHNMLNRVKNFAQAQNAKNDGFVSPDEQGKFNAMNQSDTEKKMPGWVLPVAGVGAVGLLFFAFKK